MTRTPSQHLLRSRPGPMDLTITPTSAGWGYSGLRVFDLAAGARVPLDLGADEALVLPLRGGCTVEVAGVATVLVGRPDVFAGPSDALYLPRGSVATISTTGPVRVAIPTARANRTLPLRYIGAAEARAELRGAGSMSRLVTNYTLGTDVQVDHLLVCEVRTPGGNWSSYPPHKHDVHTADERVLEEIYYFEVADGPVGSDGTRRPGFGYHRVYGSGERAIDVLEEVRDGDVVLVPHGYHGPSIAAPGYDLYYLNVMAGPAEDGRWLSTDDPDHHWVRSTWANLPLDPRLQTIDDFKDVQ